MQGIVTNMMNVFGGIKASGSYFVFLLAALYILYRVNANKNQWYIYYALGILVLICANPVLVMILSKAFPVLGDYSTFMLLAPVLLYVPLAVAEIYDRLRDGRQICRAILLSALVIAISGNFFGLYSDAGTKPLRYGAEQKAVVNIVKEKEPSMMVADESLLPFLRTKVPQVSLLYGRDLYQPGMDLGIMDGYNDELQHLYEAMKNPKDTIGDILAISDLYGCEMVIVKKFDKAPNQMGHYTKTKETGQYIVYLIQ